MARNKTDEQPIALGLYEQAYNQMPNQNQKPYTMTDAMNAFNQNYKNSQDPNPVTSTQGGAMVPNSNGINATGNNIMTKQTVPNSGDYQGIRASLNNAGINDVGWDGKNVTIGGKAYLTPQTVSDEGVAYGDRQSIQRAINQHYNDIGKPLKGAEDYVNNVLGIKGAVSWSDGNLMIGGQIVPTVYVDDDGTAYAHQSDIDNAVNSYKQSSGVKGNQNVVDDWKNAYDNRIQNALNAVMNRKEWSYDPYEDAAYKAYRDAYTREGNRAYQNAYATMAANTGGYGSSAAMNAAGQQMNYYMQQLNDKIPELQQNDYTRYLGEQELRRQALDSLRTVANDDYTKAYTANRDAIADANEANYQSYLRSKDARDFNRDVAVQDREWEPRRTLYDQQIEQGQIDTDRYAENADLALEQRRLSNRGLELNNESAELANWQAKAQKFITQLGYSGNIDAPISAEAAEVFGISPNENGEYPSYRQMVTSYAQSEAIPVQILWDEAEKQQLIDTYQINNGGI